MSKVVVEEKNYGIWGKCVRVSNGEIELYATLEIGPRIIRLSKVGGENLFFENPEKDFGVFDERMKFFGEDAKWYVYGGHRLWHAPEDCPRSYLPDNSPVVYELIENGVRLVSAPMPEISTQNIMEVTMDDRGEITVVHKVVNIGLWEIELAPWALTVLKHGGLEVVPMPDKDTGLLSNRTLMLWPYTRINDERVNWDDRYVTVSTKTGAEYPFKLGICNEDGFAMYFVDDCLFVKYFEFEEGVTYPDNGCNFETFTNYCFLECESIGKLRKLKPSETACHVEKWNLFTDVKKPENKDEIKEAVEKYIK